MKGFCSGAALALVAFSAATGQGTSPSIPPLDPRNAFPFVLPWDAVPTGGAADASFLNPVPAGANGWIVTRNGRFVESKTGRRVRFFGTNVTGHSVFPEKQDAEKIARRMKTLGINLVRFHHMNNGWALDGGTIWKPGRTFIEIDPVQLDKLDYFIAALKRNGIYSNINLQTAREYIPELGLPATVRDIQQNFGKKVDIFHPRMIELQKEYAKELLDRVNPYTKLKYKDDPALLKIEVNNENSLVGWPGESPGAGLEALPSPFKETLLDLWMDWVSVRYKTDSALAQAWRAENRLTGPNLVPQNRAWTWENQSDSDVTYQATPGATSQGFAIEVRSHSGPDWHIQTHMPGLNLQNGRTYTMQFRARADKPVAVNVTSRLDIPDWSDVGLGATVRVTPEWQNFSLSWQAKNAQPNHVRVGFVLGAMRARLEVADLVVREGTFTAGIPAGESLARRNLSIPLQDGSRRSQDWLQFLAETEAAYQADFRKFLIEDLGFRNTHIIQTQASWGGLTTFLRERESTFWDDHAYWNHPTFLGSDWDPVNYRVERRAIVDVLGAGNGTLGALAVYRAAGMPHSVSEYNHPAPSDFQVEMMPAYATFAAWQDWDAIYTFDWGATGTGRVNDAYDNYFDMSRNPAKSAFFPMAAMIFRQGLIAPPSARAVLQLPSQPWLQTLTASVAWSNSGGADPLKERLAMKVLPEVKSARIVRTGRPGTPLYGLSGTGASRVATFAGPGAAGAFGFIGGRTTTAGPLTLNLGRFGANYGAISLNAVGSPTLASARKMLLTVGGRVENQGMAWNADRTSVADQWGRGPVKAEVVPGTVSIRVPQRMRVFRLGPDGRRQGEVAATYRNGRLSFALGRTMWYEIVRG
ncbi:MAG: carbohydrate binding domain-containing protein [Fimbriimonadaceae bacterium]|nr:carbohydrate binding domain-containing protein [Fimbriimonadaceae bacterium]